MRFSQRIFVAVVVSLFMNAGAFSQTDPLRSWNDGTVKTAIMDFVSRTTTQGSPDFVAPERRIAVFDNDGTLWTEQPFYFQLAFAFDQVKAMAPQHPEWKGKQPFKSLIEGDLKSVLATARRGWSKSLLLPTPV